MARWRSSPRSVRQRTHRRVATGRRSGSAGPTVTALASSGGVGVTVGIRAVIACRA